MRLDQSSVDISTLVEKVRRGEIDLQPHFQRGQVWADSKKKRLIDTVLRQWYVPAIHIVVNEELDREEILDGQQRLRSIIDFMDDDFRIDGRIQPFDEEIEALNGMFYSQLPDRIKARFRRFTITTVRLRDFRPEEPGELFFRLNQLTALTSAEQRNALFGTPRNQIKTIVKDFERRTENISIGFTNSRMNYDDTVARVALTLELGSLSERVTASRLEQRYRLGDPFSPLITDQLQGALRVLSEIMVEKNLRTRLNKGSLFSWLYFYVYYSFGESGDLAFAFDDFFPAFESTRLGLGNYPAFKLRLTGRADAETLELITSIFNDRSSSRVNDTSSVLLRDLCLVVSFASAFPNVAYASEHFGVRQEAIDRALRRLERFPSDVAERTIAESALARMWEARRAAS